MVYDANSLYPRVNWPAVGLRTVCQLLCSKCLDFTAFKLEDQLLYVLSELRRKPVKRLE